MDSLKSTVSDRHSPAVQHYQQLEQQQPLDSNIVPHQTWVSVTTTKPAMSRRKIGDLYRAPFPLYTVHFHRETGLVITAGGGGASKTGIKNGVHFLSLELVEGKHSATLLHSHDTETRATMNMAVAGNVMAAGQDGCCYLMRFQQLSPKDLCRDNTKRGGSGDVDGPRRRDGHHQGSGGGGGLETRNESSQVKVEVLGEVCSDLSPTDALQKCVRFSPEHNLLLTGGADGHVRVWEYPSLKKKLDFKAHEGEIQDLDISSNKKIVTVGRDFACCVWSDDQLAMGLRWQDSLPHIAEKMYRYQACRFGKVEDLPGVLRLYTVQVPHKRDRKPPACYITKWEGQNFLPLLTKPCGKEVISCLEVSDSGTFLGLGTVTGSVAIFIAFSLQKLYYVQEAHGIVVTDLAFLPEVVQGKNFLGDNEVAMLSVAVDSRCQMHIIPNRRSFPMWLVVLLCGLLIVAVVFLLQQVFPGFI